MSAPPRDTRRARQLAAIEAIAAGRVDDAARIVQELRDEPPAVQRGRCRYCGCTEARGCGIVVDAGHEFAPSVIRCAWADGTWTVCTNVSCLERWRREAPAEANRVVVKGGTA